MLPTKFRFIWPSCFRGEDFFLNWPIRNKNCLWQPCALTNQDEMCNLHSRLAIRCFLPSFLSLGQAVSEEKICLNRPIRNKNCLWQPCLLMDQDKISNLYRGTSVDASSKVSVLLDKRFQRICFRTRPIRNKNCMWRPCL